MRLIVLALMVAGCSSSSGISGVTDARSDPLPDPAPDAPGDPAADETATWECIEDTECEDGDPCTLDTCDPGTHACTSETIHGMALTLDEVQVTDDHRFTGAPRMAWTGSEIGLTWTDGRDGECYDPWGPRYCEREIYFKKTGPRGEALSPDTRLSTSEGSTYPTDILWTGSEFVVSWTQSGRYDYRAYLTRVGPDGAEVGDEVRPAGGDSSRAYELAWTGSEIALSWAALEVSGVSPTVVLLSRFDPALAEISITTIRPERGYSGPLAWTGSEFATAYDSLSPDNSRFLRIDALGEPIGEGTDLGARFNSFARIMWTGSEYGLLWTGGLPEDEYCELPYHDCSNLLFIRLDPAGTLSSEHLHLTTTGSITTLSGVVWTGSEYGLTWYAETGWDHEPTLTRLYADGTRIAEDLPLPRPSSLVWTGSTYVIGYNDEREGAYNIFMNRTLICE